MKPEMHHFPPAVLVECNVAFQVGVEKHGGAHNWREDGVSANDYYSKAMRHLQQWQSGEDTDPETKTLHIINAIDDLAVLADCYYLGKMEDDRPKTSSASYQLRVFTKDDNVVPLYQPSQHVAMAWGLEA